MIKRINYTKRKKIDRRYVRIHRTTGACGFDVDWDLASYDFPQDALVLVEVTTAGGFAPRRFPFGMVGDKRPSVTERLADEMFDAARVELRVVVPDDSARILGVCRGLTFRQGNDGRSPLLPVQKSRDLGQETWRLDFESDGRSVLLVNADAIRDAESYVLNDKAFHSLVFPTIVREALRHAAEQHDEQPDPSDESHSARWIQWADRMTNGREPFPSTADREADDVAEERAEWIEAIVRAFCSTKRLGDAFKEHLLEGGDR